MTARDSVPVLERIFPGDGEMARRMRGYSWKDSPLGDPAAWPQSLRTAVHLCLTSRFPIVLWWGRELRLLYNDAWRPVLGRTKHPAALGAPGREVWPEIWHIIGPMFQSVLERGEATWSDDQLLPLDRNGYLEEAYFTYSYSPIPDEKGGVGGVFAAVSETTLKVLAERRLRTLRELAAQTLQAKGAVEAARAAMQTLAANRADVPFALLYLVDGEGQAKLEQFSPAEVEPTSGGWPIQEAIASGEPILLDNLAGSVGVLPSPWETPPQHALVLPLKSAGQGRVLAVLVLGVNPARELDEAHRGFLDMAARHIANSVAHASAYEEERRRAKALAELDQAKTAFFSNVSHEFRTPLTLMLGPVEDILAKPSEEVLPANRAALEVVHRNGQRLLRLVNTLLDFARIEGGRALASYEPVNLAQLTAELASNFRSACETAGLRLSVDCPPAGEAYVDREMWEKIVLNLLSNAFKFTLEGEIAVQLRREGGKFELAVRDTGTGIPEAALPRMFERFYRVEGAHGRSHEGSGIGLALVQELVKLHGGTIRVESRLGAGSTFTVSIPAGAAHLPADRIRTPRGAASTALRAGAFVDEALAWLPGTTDAPGGAPKKKGARRVLLADDNADLREYARRLLTEHYDVEAVGDGEAALAAMRARRPDLLVTDLMMPKLDGFGLVAALRADEALRDVPVIALSARAGEEARIEGLGKGADDYLTKPFSARELLVRCEALLRSAEIRREADARVRAIVETTPECVKLVAPDGTLLQMNAAGLAMVGAPCAEAVLGRCIYDVIAPEDRERFRQFNERVCAGERGRLEFDIVSLDGTRRHMETHAVPLARPQGGLDQLAITRDVTERKRAEAALKASEERYRHVLGLMPAAVYTCEAPSGVITYYNEHAAALWGRRPRPGDCDERFCGSFRLWLPDGTPLPHDQTPMALAMRENREFRNREVVIERPDGSQVTVLVNIDPLRDAHGRVTGAINVFHDVTERRRAEERLRRSEQDLSDFFETASIGLHWVGPDGTILRANPAELQMLGYRAEEYIGRHIAEFHVDQAVIGDILARLTRGERLSECPARMRCKDGSIRDVLISSSVLFENGRFIHTRCFTQDVTERRRLEDLLLCQKEALEMVTQRQPLEQVLEHLARAVESRSQGLMTAIHLLDAEGRRFGTAVAPSLPAAYLQATIGLEIGPGVGPCCDVVMKGETVASADVAGDPRWAPFVKLAADCGIRAGWSTPILSSQGRVIGTFANYYREPREPHPLDCQLPEMVTRTVALAVEHRQAEEALRESDRRKDDFIAMLSHELRNPLAPLRSGLELMGLGGPAGTDGKVREMMERQVAHLARLVDDLLESSRITRGLLELKRAPVELAEVLRSAVEATEPLVRENAHRLEVSLPREPLWVDGDAVRLAQTFANLLNNAARYTPRGGRIWLQAARADGAKARVSVRDTGAGFAPAAGEALFQMFSRGERSRGLGIGLALVRKLVEMHDGSVEAHSAGEGRGAEFVVTLPLATAAARPAPAAPHAAARGFRVLVADDNRDAAESLAALLQALGNEVNVAYDGMEAVEAARSFRPDVILLDLGMPGLDGYGAARAIRSDPDARAVKIVALTGWGQEEDRRRAQEAGFDAHIVKPAELDALRRVLAEVPGKRLH